MAVMKTAEVQQYLRAVNYPARKEDLLAQAEDLGADDDVLALIAQMPDQEYQTPSDVSQAIEDLAA